MSNARLKLWSFNSIKTTTEQIEKEVNDFLKKPEVICAPEDINVFPDEFTVVYVPYKINRKNTK